MLKVGETYINQYGIAVYIEEILEYQGHAKNYAAGSSGFARANDGGCFWADGPYEGKYWQAGRVNLDTGMFHPESLHDSRDLTVPLPFPEQLGLFDFQ